VCSKRGDDFEGGAARLVWSNINERLADRAVFVDHVARWDRQLVAVVTVGSLEIDVSVEIKVGKTTSTGESA
jgi:hypothetical protein